MKARGLILAALFICFGFQLSDAQPRVRNATAGAFNRTGPAPAGGGGSDTVGLVARWKLDEGTGTTAADASGNGHTATMFDNGSNPKPSWAAGLIGSGCLSFPGVNNCPVTFTAITTGTTFTYTVWVKQTGTSGYQNLITQGTAMGMWINAGKVDYYSSGDHLTATTLTTGTWHHIAVVCNAGAVTFYIDGVADANTYTGLASFDADAFGCDSNGNEPLNGLMDDARLYSVAKTGAAITAIYNDPGP